MFWRAVKWGAAAALGLLLAFYLFAPGFDDNRRSPPARPVKKFNL